MNRKWRGGNSGWPCGPVAVSVARPSSEPPANFPAARTLVVWCSCWSESKWKFWYVKANLSAAGLFH